MGNTRQSYRAVYVVKVSNCRMAVKSFRTHDREGAPHSRYRVGGGEVSPCIKCPRTQLNRLRLEAPCPAISQI